MSGRDNAMRSKYLVAMAELGASVRRNLRRAGVL